MNDLFFIFSSSLNVFISFYFFHILLFSIYIRDLHRFFFQQQQKWRKFMKHVTDFACPNEQQFYIIKSVVLFFHATTTIKCIPCRIVCFNEREANKKKQIYNFWNIANLLRLACIDSFFFLLKLEKRFFGWLIVWSSIENLPKCTFERQTVRNFFGLK